MEGSRAYHIEFEGERGGWGAVRHKKLGSRAAEIVVYGTLTFKDLDGDRNEFEAESSKDRCGAARSKLEDDNERNKDTTQSVDNIGVVTEKKNE